MAKLSKDESLTIVSMGKAFACTAIFPDDESANKYLERSKNEGVIATIQGFVFIASLYEIKGYMVRR